MVARSQIVMGRRPPAATLFMHLGSLGSTRKRSPTCPGIPSAVFSPLAHVFVMGRLSISGGGRDETLKIYSCSQLLSAAGFCGQTPRAYSEPHSASTLRSMLGAIFTRRPTMFDQVWPVCGQSLRIRAQLNPFGVKTRPSLADSNSGRCSTNVGPMPANCCLNATKSTKVGPMLANFGPTFTKLGQHRPNVGRLVQIWPIPASFVPNTAEFGPMSTNFGRLRPNLGEFGQLRPTPSSFRPGSTNVCQLRQDLNDVVQRLPISESGTAFDQLGPKATKLGQCRPIVDLVRWRCRALLTLLLSALDRCQDAVGTSAL